MRSGIDVHKLADVQSLANKLAELPDQTLLYIAGYAEGVLSVSNVQKPAPPPSAERPGA